MLREWGVELSRGLQAYEALVSDALLMYLTGNGEQFPCVLCECHSLSGDRGCRSPLGVCGIAVFSPSE